ncbi:TPA: hypothetical protein N0F65_000701 [Lagenidium giganteum]|uniref:Flavodoxin-like domain-containing protein n=1 Tax=Lagenidium giganteum TaxID=4803 RepID=A0AAV2YZ02_9STRA|nr:TPA: hypothetical protein N0F65_000701 [Lagenidium giganteum]
MTKIAIVYYSMYGHIAKMAEAVKEGVELVTGCEAEIYQIEETLPEDVLAKMHAPPKKDHPIATPDVLKEADGVLFGFPTRFGCHPGQVRAFFDRCGQLWQAQALAGKPAGIFVSTATQGGGQETTALVSTTFLVHHGMVFVPLGYRTPLLFNNDEVHGGGPWGAGTLAGPTGARQPSELELNVAKAQGEGFAAIAKKLAPAQSGLSSAQQGWLKSTPATALRWVHGTSRDASPHDRAEAFPVIAQRVKHELSLIRSLVSSAHITELLESLRREAAREDLWSDPDSAARIVQELGALEARDGRVSELRTSFLDTRSLFQLATEEDDAAMIDECRDAMYELEEQAKQLRLDLLLTNDGDLSSCFVEVQAGAGGTDSCDWVAMLARMYTRWAERRGFGVHQVDASPGDEAGFRSVCLRVDGAYAYGWAKTEAGVHRLVRISPFDSAGRRHTSFAQVRVYPQAVMASSGSNKAVEIPPKDLRIDTFRSSGAGGQHVNTTDSAVRITHLPTGLVVQSQSERSQHRNKAEAMDVLRAKLWQRELEQQVKDKHKFTEGLGENAWGSQIRSYVLQPYKMVKDHRTNFSVSDTKLVLDGELDRFMEETLLMQAATADIASPSGH